MRQPCILLKWDSQHWGFPVGRLQGSYLSLKRAGKAFNWCKKHRVRCLYFAAAGSCAQTLAQAKKMGFQYVDVKLVLENKLVKSKKEKKVNANIRTAQEVDLANLKKLARRSHKDTRFFKDLNFNPAKSRELYAKWVEKDFRENQVFILGKNGSKRNPIGYLTAKIFPSERARINLIAIDSRHQKKKFGSKLLAGVLKILAARGISVVQVATQGSNVPALRLYEKAGFRIVNSKAWFHRWFL